MVYVKLHVNILKFNTVLDGERKKNNIEFFNSELTKLLSLSFSVIS